MIVDVHTHTLAPSVAGMVAGAIGPDSVPYQRDMAEESKARDREQGPELARKFNDVDRRLANMAAMGVDRQVVAPAPGQQHYWAPAPLLAEISRVQNDHVAALVAKRPDRFVGVGTLPLTDPAAAVAEARRAATELGLRAFQIDSRAERRELSDRDLDPVWRALETLDVGVIVHPLGFSHGQRLGTFFMVNTVAQPLEELIAFNHLVFGGVLDRFPALRIAIAHGGGFAPFYVGRFDHAWKVRPEVRRLVSRPPSDYLGRLWYDTCVFRPDHVETLVRLVGAEKVMLGSDYPFDMGDPDPVGLLGRSALPEADKETIRSRSALAFLGVEA